MQVKVKVRWKRACLAGRYTKMCKKNRRLAHFQFDEQGRGVIIINKRMLNVLIPQ